MTTRNDGLSARLYWHMVGFKGSDVLEVTEPTGVYVISQPKYSIENQCIYVGQGDIFQRRRKHWHEPEIDYHDLPGALDFHWAVVDGDYCDGVEKYLGMLLCPRVGKLWPNAEPIEVNLPDFRSLPWTDTGGNDPC